MAERKKGEIFGKISLVQAYVLSIFVVSFLFGLYFLKENIGLTWVLLPAFIYAVLAILAYYGVAKLIYGKLAPKGKLWALCPHNKAICRMNGDELTEIFLAPNTEARPRVERWKRRMEEAGVSYKITILRDSGLCWIGMPPRFTVREFIWSKYREDEAEVVKHSIHCGDEVITLGSLYQGYKKDDKGEMLKAANGEPIVEELSSGFDPHGVPVYESADPVGVASALRIIMRFQDFEKAGFVLKRPKDTLKDIVLEVWRRVLSRLHFFPEGIKGEFDKQAEEAKRAGAVEDLEALEKMEAYVRKTLQSYRPEILQKSQGMLRYDFGIGDTARNINKREELGLHIVEPAAQRAADYAKRMNEEAERLEKIARESGREKDRLKAEAARQRADEATEASKEARKEADKAWEKFHKEEDNPEETKDPIVLITDPDLFRHHSKAEMIYHRYGVQIVDLLVVDLEETGGIRASLNTLLTALVTKRTDVIKASGQAQSDAIKGAGSREKTRQEILGFETEAKKDKEPPSDEARRAYITAKMIEAMEKKPGDVNILGVAREVAGILDGSALFGTAMEFGRKQTAGSGKKKDPGDKGEKKKGEDKGEK